MLHHGKPAATRVALEQLRRAYPDPQHPVVILVENGPPPVAAGELGITVVRLPANVGYGAGNNAGIRAALQTGVSFVILVNNDVVLGPGSLEGLVAALSREVGLVGATLREDGGLVYGGGRVNWFTLRTELAREPKAPETLHYLHGACLGITRRCLDTIGLFREDFFLYWEDVEYGIRARRAGFRFAVAAHPEVLHAGSAAARDATARQKTYYLVRNALHCARLAAPRSAYYCAELLLPLRERLAVQRGKWVVARALADARRGVVGPAPADL